jgi:nicotinate-nucleotide--dimethylbenzimidazole phosphoribosyltransferase
MQARSFVVDLGGLPDPDVTAAAAVAERASQVLRPVGAFRRLDEIAAWLAGWQHTTHPRVRQPCCLIFAGDHGVAERGVSAYPASITAEMVRALRRGVATAAVLAEAGGVALQVIDVGVGHPSRDLASGPALDAERFEACWEAGAVAVRNLAADLLVLGEMGIGNTTAAAAVAASLFDGPVEQWVGRGTGVGDTGLAAKRAAVASAASRVRGAAPLEVLREAGGCELVALAGATVEARRRSLPTVMDGYVVTAALAPLELAQAGALDHCIAAHCSAEPGHALLLAQLRKRPLLSLELCLGEGSGGLLAVSLIRMAAAAVTDVATFSEWERDPRT